MRNGLMEQDMHGQGQITTLLECFYVSKPRERGYIEKVWELCKLQYPSSRLTHKQLPTQCSTERNLLLHLEIDEINQRPKEGARMGQGDMPLSLPSECAYQVPLKSPGELNAMEPENENCDQDRHLTFTPCQG